ncbi:MAG: glycerol-3-phosphate dehydrogenase subunit GlpB [Propionibacteriaceae bacterium]|jgi:glycerol-3-phosphate dehydrogenase subunit B|nr:glycerol-3-phosphate dehydrogenase subunit GlpB [Propionibacteriaceae bacterium]
MARIVVIGAGFSGLAAALRLRQLNHEVTLVAKGVGGLQLSQGTVDILGYAPEWVQAPFKSFAAFIEANPDHPYATIGTQPVKRGLTWLSDLLPGLVVGDMEKNVCLPTPVGAMRPTALYQPSMASGVLTKGKSYAIVGFNQLKDFSPEFCAANLTRTPLPTGGSVTATAYRIDLEVAPGEADSSALRYARALDDRPEFRTRLADAVKTVIGPEDIVGLPACLGLDDPTIHIDLAQAIGRPVFEIPLLPPGVPGMRINEALMRALRKAGARLVLGSFITGFEASAGSIVSVTVQQAGHDRELPADIVVYAPGGFESGALTLDSAGKISERTFDLPLTGTNAADLVTGDYWHDQALFKVGVRTDSTMRALGPDGAPVYGNLYAVGSILSGATRWAEKSGEGIALGSAFAAVNAIGGGK